MAEQQEPHLHEPLNLAQAPQIHTEPGPGPHFRTEPSPVPDTFALALALNLAPRPTPTICSPPSRKSFEALNQAHRMLREPDLLSEVGGGGGGEAHTAFCHGWLGKLDLLSEVGRVRRYGRLRNTAVGGLSPFSSSPCMHAWPSGAAIGIGWPGWSGRIV